MAIQFRPIQPTDLPGICDIHKATFDKHHFLVYLSPELLVKYFAKLLELNEFCYIALNDSTNKIAGYIFSGYKTGEALSNFISGNVFQILKYLIIHPKFLFEKFLFLICKLFGTTKESSIKLRIILIAVSNECKGSGVSKMLLEFYERQIKNKGEKIYGLSVRNRNETAIDFYLKNGFVKEFELFRSIYFYKVLADAK
jgi:ribosomal protein S18 acetylase RimI-like enzyme